MRRGSSEGRGGENGRGEKSQPSGSGRASGGGRARRAHLAHLFIAPGVPALRSHRPTGCGRHVPPDAARGGLRARGRSARHSQRFDCCMDLELLCHTTLGTTGSHHTRVFLVARSTAPPFPLTASERCNGRVSLSVTLVPFEVNPVSRSREHTSPGAERNRAPRSRSRLRRSSAHHAPARRHQVERRRGSRRRQPRGCRATEFRR